jgi:hypothetical protein
MDRPHDSDKPVSDPGFSFASANFTLLADVALQT